VIVSKMRETQALGVELWNDSCALNELKDAVSEGFVGATSNPVIVAQAVNADKARLLPVLDGIIRDNPRATEDEIAWKLIGVVVTEAAAVLKGKGVLCAQVSPKWWRDPQRMFEHGKELAALADNIAIKAPAVPAGIEAMEELVAGGIPVNATVSFSVSQAVAVAEAIARGEKRAKRAPRSVITIMIGRVDDHVKRVVDKEKITLDPAAIHWSGIAVFKNAVKVFKDRGLKTTLLAAAYRHQLHWSELIGPGVIQTIPYAWWKQFNASEHTPQKTLDNPVDEKLVASLRKIADFRKAHDDGGMKADEFASYGATVHTLKQFLDGYSGLVSLVRDRMLP
jgi:transaldolase